MSTGKSGKKKGAMTMKARAAMRKGQQNQGVHGTPGSVEVKVAPDIKNTYTPGIGNHKKRAPCRYGAGVLTFSAAPASAGGYVFSANGMTDPNITGGSLVPSGFIQMMQFFDHYVVVRSRITVVFTNRSTVPIMVGVVLRDSDVLQTNINQLLEDGQSNYENVTASPYGGSTRTIVKTCVMEKWTSASTVLGDSVYRGDVLNNPSEQTYYHLMAYSQANGSAEVNFSVVIDYDAVFYEPRGLAPGLGVSVDDQMRQLQFDFINRNRCKKKAGDTKDDVEQFKDFAVVHHGGKEPALVGPREAGEPYVEPATHNVNTSEQEAFHEAIMLRMLLRKHGVEEGIRRYRLEFDDI